MLCNSYFYSFLVWINAEISLFPLLLLFKIESSPVNTVHVAFFHYWTWKRKKKCQRTYTTIITTVIPILANSKAAISYQKQNNAQPSINAVFNRGT